MLEFQGQTQIPAEEELVERVRLGDRSAASALFGRHARVYYQAAYRVLRNREEARDAVQDGLLLAFRNAAYSRLRASAKHSPRSAPLSIHTSRRPAAKREGWCSASCRVPGRSPA